MAGTSENIYRAPALEKGLEILEFLAAQPTPCSKTQIAESLNKSPNEIYRMLSVLEERGYLRKQPGTQAYQLSLKLFQLSNQQNNFSSLRIASRVPMEQLANRIGQACHLSIAQADLLLVMMERMPSRKICLAVGEGTAIPLSQTASGCVSLSLMDAAERDSILASDSHFRNRSRRKQQEYLKHVLAVGKQGYEIALSQVTSGVIDIALPVGITGTDMCGVLAVSQIGLAIDSPIIRKTLREMQTCAKDIHRNLGI